MTLVAKVNRPYGLWDSPITTHTLTADNRLYDVKWDTHSGALVWHERRASGHALVVQMPDANPRDLVRETRVGGQLLFGGGGFTVGHGSVYFVGGDGRIYDVPLTGGLPQPLTPAYGRAAAPALSPDGMWLAYVHSVDEVEHLVVVSTNRSSHKYPHLLFSSDFIMQPVWTDEHLAFVTWSHPHMPWDQSELHLLTLTYDHLRPIVTHYQVIAGDEGGVSIMGTAFSPNGKTLAYTSDRKGWWQLYLYDLEHERHYQLTQDEAEYAVPAWLHDMRTFGWSRDGNAIYALRNADSIYTLVKIALADGKQTPLKAVDRYTHFEQIAVSPRSDKIAMIAGASNIPDRIVSLQPDQNAPYIHAYSSTESINTEYLTSVMDISWETDDGTVIHGLYYPPTNPRYQSGGVPPLIVLVHSGPTRQRFARYFPEPHFFATRGYAVLEPNYRGSTGYGRDFKDRLRGAWGGAEVEDCVRGARYLVKRGLADRNRLVIMGNSSGGYTVLQSLIQHPDVYRVGIAQAPVTDHFALVEDTHKFERHYNDVLVGALPAAAELYRERSPVRHAAEIQTPLALFHGTSDTVVPVQQSDAIVRALRVPYVYRRYEGEGHSFRQPETLRDQYDTVLRFLREHVVY